MTEITQSQGTTNANNELAAARSEIETLKRKIEKLKEEKVMLNGDIKDLFGRLDKAHKDLKHSEDFISSISCDYSDQRRIIKNLINALSILTDGYAENNESKTVNEVFEN